MRSGSDTGCNEVLPDWHGRGIVPFGLHNRFGQAAPVTESNCAFVSKELPDRTSSEL